MSPLLINVSILVLSLVVFGVCTASFIIVMLSMLNDLLKHIANFFIHNLKPSVKEMLYSQEDLLIIEDGSTLDLLTLVPRGLLAGVTLMGDLVAWGLFILIYNRF